MSNENNGPDLDKLAEFLRQITGVQLSSEETSLQSSLLENVAVGVRDNGLCVIVNGVCVFEINEDPDNDQIITQSFDYYGDPSTTESKYTQEITAGSSSQDDIDGVMGLDDFMTMFQEQQNFTVLDIATNSQSKDTCVLTKMLDDKFGKGVFCVWYIPNKGTIQMPLHNEASLLASESLMSSAIKKFEMTCSQ